MISSRLEFERIEAAVEALKMTGLPSAVLRRDGRVLACNALLEALSPQIRIAARDVVNFQYGLANRRLADAVELARGLGSLGGCSFPLPQTDRTPPAAVHLVPFKSNACDIFVSAAFFLIVTPIDRSRVLNAEKLQGLFDLTPTEARVARFLARGADVAETANEMAVSKETVRSHVKSILSKSHDPPDRFRRRGRHAYGGSTDVREDPSAKDWHDRSRARHQRGRHRRR